MEPTEADGLLLHVILDDEGRQDPYPAYERLRRELPQWRNGAGGTVLTRYQDCVDALRNPRLGRPEPDMEIANTLTGAPRRAPEQEVAMLFLNPPDHTRIRSLVSRAFTPRRVEALRPAITALLDPVLDRFAEQGGGDVVRDLAVPFPVAVISELLGVPPEDSAALEPDIHAGTALIDATLDEQRREQGEAAVQRVAEYFVELAAHKRQHPDGTMFSDLIQVELEGERLSEAELIGNTILLYAAGFETTSNLIGNGLRALLTHPDQVSRLRADRSLVPSAVLEMLRYDSPVQLNVRAVLEKVELFGRTWDRGELFIVLQGAGNRDDAVYPDAESFDVGRFDPAAAGREAPPPLSFGWGAHHCLGAHLARAEGEVVFDALLDRFAHVELDTAALGGGTPHYRPSFTRRGLSSLPV
ncbi:MAG: cytochrome P450, partial [Actinomycetes bacterium]